MQGVNAAVVSDLVNTTDEMIFYSISETIDPETGYDSRSGKTLPCYITQISGFSMAPIRFNQGQWNKIGLKMMDYVVKTKVKILHYTKLMRDTCEDQSPFLLLIDTEGYDCDILLGISPDSMYIPKFLVFESHQCKNKMDLVHAHLQQMNFTVVGSFGQNTVAYR